MDGEQLKIEGQAKALANPIAQAWKIRAANVVLRLARSGREFTVEDVRSGAGDPPTMAVMGAVMAANSKRGIIRRTRFEKAHRTTSHARHLAVWTGGDTAHDPWTVAGPPDPGADPEPAAAPPERPPVERWEHPPCGEAFTYPPGSATIDSHYRQGKCPSCKKKGVFIRS